MFIINSLPVLPWQTQVVRQKGLDAVNLLCHALSDKAHGEVSIGGSPLFAERICLAQVHGEQHLEMETIGGKISGNPGIPPSELFNYFGSSVH